MILLLLPGVFGQTPVKKQYKTTRISTAPYINGILDDAVWQSGSWIDDFTQYFKDKNWMFNLNAAFSVVEGSKKALENTQRSSARYFQRPDNNYTVLDTNRTSLAGSGGRMQIMKLNGHWNFIGATIWKTPGFETNDLGYIREADQILSVIWTGYNQWEPKWIYRRYNINADFYFLNNFGGDQVGKGFEWNASMGLKNYWNVWAGGNFSSSNDSGNLDLLNDVGGLFDKDDNKPHNVFLIKFSYRFGLK